MSWPRLAVTTASCIVVMAACGTDTPTTRPTSAATALQPVPTTPMPYEPAEVIVPYRVEVRSNDPAVANFAEALQGILTDRRGWVRAGFRFVHDPTAPYLIVLAEAAEVDRLCKPMDTYGKYSCQNGPVVALNADRWRSATPQWTGDLDGYRVMLVNHEVGHLLHLHHPTEHCPGDGLPAPVMAQQSTELGPCVPNPWPLQWEVELAAQRREPLAPPPGHDAADHRPTPPPAAPLSRKGATGGVRSGWIGRAEQQEPQWRGPKHCWARSAATSLDATKRCSRRSGRGA